jgi:hypothetical protein
LVVRYGNGTDEGIFHIRDMLINSLGFAPQYTTMAYYDKEDPFHKPDGVHAPTASFFEESFTTIVSEAQAGDIVFVYVDAKGLCGDYQGDDAMNSVEGFKLAAADDGTRTEDVYADWLGETIRKVCLCLENVWIRFA